jgi:hypothetical protein
MAVPPGENDLLTQVVSLGRELGPGEIPEDWVDLVEGEWPPLALTDPADRQLIRGLRTTLVKVAAAHRLSAPSNPATLLIVRGAVDGAHLTARNEILTGNRDQLRRLIPGLVYATLIPIADEAVALRVAARAALILEAGL